MDTLIPVVVILAVVCFIGYKNREKLSALYDKVQNDHLDDEPEVSTKAPEIVTIVPNVGSPVPNVGSPYKVEPAVAAPVNLPQEVHDDFAPVKLVASPMPRVIPDTYTKYTVNLKANQLYSLKMTVTNKNPNRSIGLTPTTGDPARLGASYFIKLIGAAGEIPYKSRPGNAFKQFRSLAPGDYTVEITSDKDSQVFAHFK